MKFFMMNAILIFLITLILSLPTFANETGSSTGFKLPRYVSLKSNDSNLRVGSSTNYPIKIKYIVPNTPVEIIDEYKDWRKIIDYENNIGWMHKSLIKGNRFAIVNQPYSEKVQVHDKPNGHVIGKIGKNNIVNLNKCLIEWCFVIIKKNKGWVNKKNLWGVYKNETFNIPFYQPLTNLLWQIEIKKKVINLKSFF